jgi:hypothetical protein
VRSQEAVRSHQKLTKERRKKCMEEEVTKERKGGVNEMNRVSINSLTVITIIIVVVVVIIVVVGW